MFGKPPLLVSHVDTLSSSDDDKDAFIMFSYENNAFGTLGIAPVSVTCWYQKKYRVSINEYFMTQQMTAIVSIWVSHFS